MYSIARLIRTQIRRKFVRIIQAYLYHYFLSTVMGCVQGNHANYLGGANWRGSNYRGYTVHSKYSSHDGK